MYESPITQNIADIATQIREAQDGRLVYEVQQAIGYDINKEELIKALKYDRDQYQKGYEDGRKDSEWIPVSERLPEKDGEYLLWGKVTEDEENNIFIGSYDSVAEAFGYWQDWYDPSTLSYVDGELNEYASVIAWMPLPEPYKGVSE